MGPKQDRANGKPRSGRKPGRKPNAAATYQAGLAAFEQGRLPEAIELLTIVADQGGLPGTLARFYLGQAHLRHGLVELRLGRHASAARHLTAARQINPASGDLSRFLLACQVGRGRFDLAARELEKNRDEGRGDDILPIRLAHALARDGQRSQAVETLEKAIFRDPRRTDLRFQLGLLHAAVEDFDQAVEVFEGAVALAPLDAAIRRHLGLALGARGNPTKAVEHLSLAQKLQPHDAYLALLLTLAVKAAQAEGAGVSVEPASAEEMPPDDEAIETLGKVILDDPDFVEAFLSLPESEVDREIFAMLAAILERALQRHPDYADLHFHCSRVYARLGRTESAITEADQAVRINPRYAQALIQLGRLYAQTDQNAQAIDRFNQAVRSGGDYPDVHFMLGKLYQMDGCTDRARTEFRRALDLNTDYTSARRALAALATA